MTDVMIGGLLGIVCAIVLVVSVVLIWARTDDYPRSFLSGLAISLLVFAVTLVGLVVAL